MSFACESARGWMWMRALGAIVGAVGALGYVASAAAQQAPDAGVADAAPAAVLGDPTAPGTPPPPPPAGDTATPAGYQPAAPAQPPPPAPGAYGQTPVAPGYGQQPGYGQPGNALVEPLAPAPPEPVEHIRTDDANADHVVIGSTAFTAPKGSVYFSSYELILLQGGVAVTDNFQLTLTTLPPLITDQPYFVDLSAKFAFLQTPRFHMAAIGSLLAFGGADLDSVFAVGRLGIVGTACLTENCYVNISASSLFWLSGDLDRVVPVTLNLGVTARVAGIFSLLAEANLITAVGDLGSSSIDLFDAGALIGYGVRFSSGNFGFDLTFLRPVGFGDDTFILGVPWLAFTYRSDPLF